MHASEYPSSKKIRKDGDTRSFCSYYMLFYVSQILANVAIFSLEAEISVLEETFVGKSINFQFQRINF